MVTPRRAMLGVLILMGMLAAVVVAPRHTGAQSSGAAERLTGDIAEHALAPGTTKEAAEAWFRYWEIRYDVVPPGNCCTWLGTRAIPAGAKSVLEGTKLYSTDAISADIVWVYVFLGADNRVLRVMAEEGSMIEE